MTEAILEISDILGDLLKQHRITEAELARQINVPRATINRLVSGRTPDPRASTLNTIAKYFNITVDQLIGKSFIHHYPEQHFYNHSIPILKLEETEYWENYITTNQKEQLDCITVDESIEEGKFAVRVNGDAMWPQFQDNSILIINPYKTTVNRDFVITFVKNNNEVLFRQLLIEGKYRFLKAINSLFPSIELQNCDRIIGTVIQTRKNYG